ncbi:MAG: hypothetical protein DI606_02265 [Sphingobium sp.]|jgi:hypothetical protein|uniref:hypothetical protein n=1 Tax=Sphingobium sp. TaxID=1912891 RepID=UPI000DB80DEC|nr:hypothetical protein [Sphingobium sp.]PZU14485.1 MAG: hypothetical protein DI606_02265 [Sphingobium sp.]
MALIGWIVSFLALFGGLALRQDMPIGGSDTISDLLIALAVLACPMLWREKPLGISRGQRIVVALILLCATPLLLMPPT